MSKKIITMLSLCLLGVMMSGCSSQESNTVAEEPKVSTTEEKKEEVKKEEAKPNKAVEISVMLPQTHYKDFVKELINKFESENSGYKMDIQAIPDNQWIDLVKTKAAVEEVPDIVRIDKGLMVQIGADKFVEFDESEAWYSRALPSQLEGKLIDGKLYGLPASADSSVGIVYNNDVFKQYNLEVPKTYEEMLNVCETFKANGVIPLYASDKDTWTTQIWFAAAGPQVVGEETWQKLMSNEAKWTDYPEFVDLMSKMKELRDKGYTNEDYLAATYDGGHTLLAEGKAAMVVSGQFVIGEIQKANSEVDIRIAPTPFSDELTVAKGPGMFGIFKQSKVVEEAKVFLEWLSQPENMNVFNQGWGEFALFQDQNMEMEPWKQEVMDKYIATNKTIEETNNQLIPMDLNDFWTYQQEMLAGGITPEQVFEKWQASFEMQGKSKGVTGF